MSTRVIILNEVSIPLKTALNPDDNDSLCLQEVIYDYGTGNNDNGFRFIRRGPSPKRNLKAQKGQANCISLENIEELLYKMRDLKLAKSIIVTTSKPLPQGF